LNLLLLRLQAVANSEATLSAAIAEANRGVAEVEGVQDALEEQQQEYQNLMQHMRVRYVCVIAADAFGFCLTGVGVFQRVQFLVGGRLEGTGTPPSNGKPAAPTNTLNASQSCNLSS
jgi:hypothetical protein